MNRDPLSEPGFSPSFSGHETFPLRQLWLRKVYRAVAHHLKERGEPAPRGLFTNEESISRFGAGKNMVQAMLHWGQSCGVITDKGRGYVTTPEGDFLFDEKDGHDPFQERIATAWLIHWYLTTEPRHATTWYWAFNRFNQVVFSKGDLERSIFKLIEDKNYKVRTETTIDRDVQCFIRSYCTVKAARGDEFRTDSVDDLAEPVLAELNLISPIGRDAFQFQRGEKPSLPNGVFNYSLHQFWQRYFGKVATLPFDAIAYAPGSPGLVFKLDEGALANRLLDIEGTSDGAFSWSDTAGLRQILRGRPISAGGFELLEQAYVPSGVN